MREIWNKEYTTEQKLQLVQRNNMASTLAQDYSPAIMAQQLKQNPDF